MTLNAWSMLSQILNHPLSLTKHPRFSSPRSLVLLWLSFSVLSISLPALAQTSLDSIPPPASNARNVRDSSLVMKPKRLEPGQVFYISIALPGFGQYYNRSYWKIPILYGFLGWFGYQFNAYNNLYGDYRNRYLQDLTQTPLPTNAEFNRRLRDFYRGVRDEFGVYFVLAYIAGLVDAYIDAHLFDFDSTEDINASYNTLPFQPATKLLRVQISF
jgi:hypothetical protein